MDRTHTLTTFIALIHLGTSSSHSSSREQMLFVLQSKKTRRIVRGCESEDSIYPLKTSAADQAFPEKEKLRPKQRELTLSTEIPESAPQVLCMFSFGEAYLLLLMPIATKKGALLARKGGVFFKSNMPLQYYLIGTQRRSNNLGFFVKR